jgi:hypothetical protein
VNFHFEQLQALLRKRADHPAVMELTNRKPNEFNRSAHTGYVALVKEGISVMFKEAPWVVPVNDTTDLKSLHLDAFHFRREGHDGYSQFTGVFPKNIAFGNSRPEIESKLGKPAATGGGGYIKLLKKPIPHWLKYSLGKDWLHLQLDADGKLEMVTLHVPNLQEEKPKGGNS